MNLSARDARPEDNDALVALSAACPMEGEIGLCVDRVPDFFALNRLEGDSWRVGVVDGPDGSPIGCISVAERDVYINRKPTRALYVSDLKVHRQHRGGGVADVLTEWARDVCVAAGADGGGGNGNVVTFLTILAGNEAMERRMTGPRGMPRLQRIATVRTHTVSLLWKRRRRDAGVRVVRAQPGDVEEMAALLAGGRPRAPVLRRPRRLLASGVDRGGTRPRPVFLLAGPAAGRWPGRLRGPLEPDLVQADAGHGLLAEAGERTAGFNLLAPLVGATRLPPPGGQLRNLNAVHVCVAPDEPAVLRALLVEGYNAARGKGYSFLNVGLDREDPLAPAVRGLWAQPTDIWFCLATSAGASTPRLDPGPVHHEIALV